MTVVFEYNDLIWRSEVNPAVLGYLPEFLHEGDMRDAVLQLDASYQHAGGWRKFEGFTLHKANDPGEAYLSYPGDPPMREMARTRLRTDLVIIFEYAWVAVVRDDGTHEIARMD